MNSSSSEKGFSNVNIMDQVNDYEISRFSRPLLTFAATITIIIMIIGIFGNLLTIIALLKCPKVRNVAAAFIISLCVADFLFCAIVLPFSAFRFIHGTWTHGDFLCQLIPFIQYGNIGVSLLCIAMITINRYIMIAHHGAYVKIYKRHWIGAMIVFCWLFSYGMQLPTLLKVWGEFDFDPKLGTCSITTDANGRSSKTALFVIAFVIPCIIIIACYTKIFCVVHQSENRLRKHAHKQNSIPNNLRQKAIATTITTATTTTDPNNRMSSPVSTSSLNESSCGMDSKFGTSQKTIRVKDQRDIKAKRNEWRITKMVLAIFLSFIICYLPITLAKVADKNVEYPGFHVFSYLALYLSSCINPIIYVIMNKQYRKAYKTVLMCEPSKLLPFTKVLVGSSVAEKWKDIGYNCNHSRTMVSVVDQQNSSFSSSQQQQPSVVMELSSVKQQQPTFNNSSNISNSILAQGSSNARSIQENTENIFLATKMDFNSRNPLTQSAIMSGSTNSNNNNSQQVANQNNLNTHSNGMTTMNTNSNYQQHQQQQQQQLHQPVSLHSPITPQQSTKRLDIPHPRLGTRITLGENDVIVEEEEEISLTTPAMMKNPVNYIDTKKRYGQNMNATPDSDKIAVKSKILGV